MPPTTTRTSLAERLVEINQKWQAIHDDNMRAIGSAFAYFTQPAPAITQNRIAWPAKAAPEILPELAAPTVTLPPAVPAVIHGYGRGGNIHCQTERVPFRYAVIDASALIPSHNASSFRANPAHPGGQERDYTHDKAERLKVILNSAPDKFSADLILSDDPTPSNGPPMILASGAVLGGNSRAMVIQRVYAGKGAADLRAATITACARFGIDASAAESMERPAIVRMLTEQATEPARLSQLSRVLQKGLTQELSAGRDCAARARMLMGNPDSLAFIDDMLADGRSIREVLASDGASRRLLAFLQSADVLSAQEITLYAKPTGGFAEEGKRLVERTLLATVVSDPGILDDIPQPIVNKLAANLADLAFTRARDGWNLQRPIESALCAYQRFRVADMGSTAADLRAWIDQTDQMTLIPDAIAQDADGRTILELLVGETAQGWRDRIKAYGAACRSCMPGQIRMFGADVEPAAAFAAAFGDNAGRMAA